MSEKIEPNLSKDIATPQEVVVSPAVRLRGQVREAFQNNADPLKIAEIMKGAEYDNQVGLVREFIHNPIDAMRPISTRYRHDVIEGAPTFITKTIKRLKNEKLKSVNILNAVGIHGDLSVPMGRLLNFQGIPNEYVTRINPFDYEKTPKPPEGTYHDIYVASEQHDFSTDPAYWLRTKTIIRTIDEDFPVGEEIYQKAKVDASEIPVALADAIRRVNSSIPLNVAELKKIWVEESDEYLKIYNRLGKNLLSQDGFRSYENHHIDIKKWEAWTNEYKAVIISNMPHWYSPRALEVLKKIELEILEDLAKSYGRWREGETKKFLNSDGFNMAIVDLATIRKSRGMSFVEIQNKVSELLNQLDPLQKENLEAGIRSLAQGSGKLHGFVKGGLTTSFSEDVRNILRVATILLDQKSEK